jgi:hypothetical protein
MLKVHFQTLPKPARLTADDAIYSRVIISRTTEDRLTNLLFVYLSLSTSQGQIADIGEQTP